jgi:hypothetical protein
VHRSRAHSDGNHAVYIDIMYACMYVYMCVCVCVCVCVCMHNIYPSLGLIGAAETMLSLELQ